MSVNSSSVVFPFGAASGAGALLAMQQSSSRTGGSRHDDSITRQERGKEDRAAARRKRTLPTKNKSSSSTITRRPIEASPPIEDVTEEPSQSTGSSNSSSSEEDLILPSRSSEEEEAEHAGPGASAPPPTLSSRRSAPVARPPRGALSSPSRGRAPSCRDLLLGREARPATAPAAAAPSSLRSRSSRSVLRSSNHPIRTTSSKDLRSCCEEPRIKATAAAAATKQQRTLLVAQAPRGRSEKRRNITSSARSASFRGLGFLTDHALGAPSIRSKSSCSLLRSSRHAACSAENMKCSSKEPSRKNAATAAAPGIERTLEQEEASRSSTKRRSDSSRRLRPSSQSAAAPKRSASFRGLGRPPNSHPAPTRPNRSAPTARRPAPAPPPPPRALSYLSIYCCPIPSSDPIDSRSSSSSRQNATASTTTTTTTTTTNTRTRCSAREASTKVVSSSARRPVVDKFDFVLMLIVSTTWSKVKQSRSNHDFVEILGEQIILKMMELDPRTRSLLHFDSILLRQRQESTTTPRFVELCQHLIKLIDAIVSLVGPDMVEYKKDIIQLLGAKFHSSSRSSAAEGDDTGGVGGGRTAVGIDLVELLPVLTESICAGLQYYLQQDDDGGGGFSDIAKEAWTLLLDFVVATMSDIVYV